MNSRFDVDMVDCPAHLGQEAGPDHVHTFLQTRWVYQDAAMHGCPDAAEFEAVHTSALERLKFRWRNGVPPVLDHDGFLAQKKDLLEASLLRARILQRDALLRWFDADWHSAVSMLAITIVDLQEQQTTGCYKAAPKWMGLVTMPACKHSIALTPAIGRRKRSDPNQILSMVLAQITQFMNELRQEAAVPTRYPDEFSRVNQRGREVDSVALDATFLPSRAPSASTPTNPDEHSHGAPLTTPVQPRTAPTTPPACLGGRRFTWDVESSIGRRS